MEISPLWNLPPVVFKELQQEAFPDWVTEDGSLIGKPKCFYTASDPVISSLKPIHSTKIQCLAQATATD